MLKTFVSKILGEKQPKERQRDNDDDDDDRDDDDGYAGRGDAPRGMDLPGFDLLASDDRNDDDDDDDDRDDSDDAGRGDDAPERVELSVKRRSPMRCVRSFGVRDSDDHDAIGIVINGDSVPRTTPPPTVHSPTSTPDTSEQRHCHFHRVVENNNNNTGGGVPGGGVPGGCYGLIGCFSPNDGDSGIGGNSVASASMAATAAASFSGHPPPKRKRASRAIEESHDWCETDANWKHVEYTWTINSFSKCQEVLGNHVTSPEFPSNLLALNNHHGMMHGDKEELAFHLKVHLKGENDDSDHLAVYIVCKGPEEVLASFELSIIVDGKKSHSRDSKKVCQFAEDQHPAWGFKKFIQFDELLNEEKGYLKGDRLKLHCAVKFVVVKNLRPCHEGGGEATFKAESRVEEGMERLDVDQLWRDRELYADLTIVCQGQEIPANRVLLATRSEVFGAMLAHSNMKEAASGRIEIPDVDAAVFLQMLKYIYTGFAPNVHAIAEELLIAANKYALEELKTECVRVLESNLSVDNVLEMLVLGDQHEAAKLKEAAISFLVNRLDVFMDKNFKGLWHKFKEAHPELTTETVKVLLEKQPIAKFPLCDAPEPMVAN